MKSGVFTRYSFRSEEPRQPKHGGSKRSLHEDRDGVLWVGTVDNGLLKLDRERKQFIRYPQDATPIPAACRTIPSKHSLKIRKVG